MKRQRRNFTAKLKARIALEAVKENQTMSELSTKHEVHANMIGAWKKTLTDRAEELFDNKRGRKSEEDTKLTNRLYQQIGQLQVELDWLKKKLKGIALPLRHGWVEAQGQLSIRRQCQLSGIPRSTWYYEPVTESEENLLYMRLLDEQYLRTPFYGVPRMTQMLRQKDYEVNPKRVGRLMALMGLQAIYPKKNLSKPAPGHKIYPYLLRGLKIVHPNQVWSTDITYIRMLNGFLYLCAIMDWYSRYVISWRLSNTLDADFCIEALEEALATTQLRPEIFNTDQGSQFTSEAFTGVLLRKEVKISMDGRGRALDNVFIERLWRTVKYEHVFLHEYKNGRDLWQGLNGYWRFYNEQRPHKSLAYQTPKEVFGNLNGVL
ncbi:MAG: IS3 family transposase [Saprospiraceae bacterium]|nr:MAG: IS3 family transposase [Saprospiraceae bacterium]